MNFLKHYQNVNLTKQNKMETEDNTSETSSKVKSSEISTSALLKELIANVEAFLVNKELRALSESLKGIFYHGLSLDNQVSRLYVGIVMESPL